MSDDNDLQGVERLTPAAQELVRDLRREGVGVLSDAEKGTLYFNDRKKMTPDLMRRAREHGRELMELIESNSARRMEARTAEAEG